LALPLVDKCYQLRARHIAGFQPVKLESGAFDQTIDRPVRVASAGWRASRPASVNLYEAVSKVVQMYVSRVRKHNENEERAVDVWVLVVPEIIFERCRPDAKRAGLPMEKGDFGKKQKQRSDLPLLGDLVDHASEDIFDDAPDAYATMLIRIWIRTAVTAIRMLAVVHGPRVDSA
jgi:hypothetical protein